MKAPRYIKQLITNIKDLIDNIILLGDFNSPHTSIDRSCKQKIYKETMALNDTPGQMDLKDIFRTFHLKQQNAHSFQVHIELSPE